MADPSDMPSNGAQPTIASLEPDGPPLPSDKESRKTLVKLWLKALPDDVSMDDAYIILEQGPDKINCMHNAIEAAGTKSTADVSAWLKQLPLDQRRGMVAEIYDENVKENQLRDLKNSSTPAQKRTHQEMVAPSTNATTSSSATLPSGASSSLHSTPSRPDKRLRTGAESCTGGLRAKYFCPFCHTIRKNDKQNHIRTHLVESCSSLSPENHTNAGERADSAYLFGCGFCGPAGMPPWYDGEAHLGLEELTRHVADRHSLRESKLSWDTNKALHNILTHKVFRGDALRAKPYPYVRLMSWTSVPEAEKLLPDLEKLGGRLMDASGDVKPLDSDGEKTVAKVLDALSILLWDMQLNPHTAPHPLHPPLASTGPHTLGSQPNPIVVEPKSTATPDNPSLLPQTYTFRCPNPNVASALTQGTNSNPHATPPLSTSIPPDLSNSLFALGFEQFGSVFLEPTSTATPDNTSSTLGMYKAPSSIQAVESTTMFNTYDANADVNLSMASDNPPVHTN